MSGSDGDNTTKTGLKWSIIAASIFVAALTASGGYVQLGYYQQAANQTAKHQRWTQNEIRAGCPSFSSIAKAECAYQATKAAQENQRAEYDLYAQRTSALWAAIMAFAALLGIGLSGVGVWLVKTTFDATRQSNIIAKDGIEREHRPWIDVSIELDTAAVQMATDVSFWYQIVVENTGRSIARKIRCKPTFHINAPPGPIRTFTELFNSETAWHEMGSLAPGSSAPLRVREQRFFANWTTQPGYLEVFVGVVVEYVSDTNPDQATPFIVENCLNLM